MVFVFTPYSSASIAMLIPSAQYLDLISIA
jgi:hypothetical protein